MWLRSSSTLVVIIAVLLSATVNADQIQQNQYMSELFQRADADNNGALDAHEFATLQAHILPSGNFIPAKVDESLAEPTFYEPAATKLFDKSQKSTSLDETQDTATSFLETQVDPAARTARLTKFGRRVGGCYRVCPQPVVFRSGEPFGGPFGPDPYYSYGQNSMY